MANTVTLRTLPTGGKKDVYVHCYFKSDGASGELTNQVLADVATIGADSFGNTATKFTLVEAWYEFVGFDAVLNFHATTPVPFWKITQASGTHMCFEKFGGISDPMASGYAGKIQISTAGFTVATDEGTLILHLRKD